MLHFFIKNLHVLYLCLLIIILFIAPFRCSRRNSGLKIGSAAPTADKHNGNIGRGSGLRIGQTVSNRTSAGRFTTTTTITSTTTKEYFGPKKVYQSDIEFDQHHLDGDNDLHVGLVVPSKSFGYRDYTKSVMTAKNLLQRKMSQHYRRYELHVHKAMQEMTPSPTGECSLLFSPIHPFIHVI